MWLQSPAQDPSDITTAFMHLFPGASFWLLLFSSCLGLDILLPGELVLRLQAKPLPG